jgi:hypothetical protein
MVQTMTAWAKLPLRKLIYDIKKADCNVDAENLTDAYNELVEAIETPSDSSKLVNVSNAVKLFLHVLDGAQQSLTMNPKSAGRKQKYSDNDIKIAMKFYEDEYAESNDSKAAWNKTADTYGFKSGEAARRTVTRRMKKPR